MRMRLIDAESLKELFPDNGEGSWTYNATAKAYIDAQPTIEPERKIGRWIPDNTDYYRTKFICSACGESEEVPTTGFGYGTMWGYCPNCGAKMERRQDGH